MCTFTSDTAVHLIINTSLTSLHFDLKLSFIPFAMTNFTLVKDLNISSTLYTQWIIYILFLGIYLCVYCM